MTSAYNRRAALTLAGAGITALFTACATQKVVPLSRSTLPNQTNTEVMNTPSASSLRASEKDYAGEAKLEKYDTSAGEFVPATREHPPKNVPIPIAPKNMNENSVDGLYATIAFYAAALQYALTTGDMTYYNKVKLEQTRSEAEQQNLQEFYEAVETIEQGLAWFEDPRVTCTLTTAQPDQSSDGYIWPATMLQEYGSYIFSSSEQIMELPETEQRIYEEGHIQAEYVGGQWKIAHRAVASKGSTSSA